MRAARHVYTWQSQGHIVNTSGHAVQNNSGWPSRRTCPVCHGRSTVPTVLPSIDNYLPSVQVKRIRSDTKLEGAATATIAAGTFEGRPRLRAQTRHNVTLPLPPFRMPHTHTHTTPFASLYYTDKTSSKTHILTKETDRGPLSKVKVSC
jgi:hypothetical protein